MWVQTGFLTAWMVHTNMCFRKYVEGSFSRFNQDLVWGSRNEKSRPKRETMSIEEATVSNMWEIAAIVELLEQKGLCTKQDLYDIITEFRRKNPRASVPEAAFHEPYLLTETENTIIDDIMELLKKHGLASHQSQNLLEGLGRIIEMGQRVAKGMTH